MSLLVLTYSLSVWSIFGAHQRQAADDSLTIRVLDIQNPSIVQVYSPNSKLLVYNPYSGEIETRLAQKENVSVEQEGQGIRVQWFEGSIETSKIGFKTANGSPLHIRYGKDVANLKERVYRGSLNVGLDQKIEWKHLLITNQVQIEDYVSGVIPREYPFKEIEGIKAQAVIARTYAVGAVRRFDRYDLTDTESSQVYGGALAENFASRRAVFETRGQVVKYDGRYIESVYSSTCGGHTANNEDVWGSQPVKYLRAKPDPYDEHSPYFRWELEVDKSDLYEALSEKVGFEVTDIKTGKRKDGGYLTEVEIKGKGKNKTSLRPSTVRTVTNKLLGGRSFRSPHFRLDKGGRSIRIEGQGFGHGVGACQYGMGGMARQGFSFEDILKFYYSDIDITTLAGIESWPEFPLQPAFPEKAIEPTMVSEVRSDRSELKVRESKTRERRVRRTWNAWGRAIPENLKSPRRRRAW